MLAPVSAGAIATVILSSAAFVGAAQAQSPRDVEWNADAAVALVEAVSSTYDATTEVGLGSALTGPGGGTESVTPSGLVSGEEMPTSDLQGWRLIFTDDFDEGLPLGNFPTAVSDKWDAYPYPWTGTPTWAIYDPGRTTSFHDGMMDIWMHTEGGEHLIAANTPKINGPNAGQGQLYGRYAIRFRTDSFPYYRASFLLWPTSEVWPSDGEMNFPEGGFDGNIAAYTHWQGGTWGGDQDAFEVDIPIAGPWRTAVIEWEPGSVKYLLDGALIGHSTSQVPSTPMRYVLQNGGSFWTGEAPDVVQGHVYIDWVSVWAYADPLEPSRTLAAGREAGVARTSVSPIDSEVPR